jgi:Zn-dependent M28 family amino/carboxypeptidase
MDAAELLNDVKILSRDSMEGRATGAIGNERARSFILSRIREIGLTPLHNEFVQPFTFSTTEGDRKGMNVIAGIDSNGSENYIVISAHYDHVGIRNDQIYNGADDNASGVAALLSIGKYFIQNQPEHNLIFAFFDAEELGLQGARSFVRNNNLPIILNINLDMISRNEKNEIYIAGTHQNPELKNRVEKALEDTGSVKVLFGHDTPGAGGHDWTNSSDHGPFHQAGIPFLYFGVEDHEDYHRPTDDFQKIDPQFYSEVVNILIQVISQLDKNLN